MSLNDFMIKNFPHLILRPPLFNSWNYSIRFELGINWDRNSSYEDSPYLQGVYKRAITLFKRLHALDDEIFVVADVMILVMEGLLITN